jgi:hypothetical protein
MVVAYFFLLIPILLVGLLVGAWFVLLLFTRTGLDAIRNTPYHEFLGPGGPDDPFTVRIPREAHVRQHAQTGPRALRKADGERLPRPDKRTGLPPAA